MTLFKSRADARAVVRAIERHLPDIARDARIKTGHATVTDYIESYLRMRGVL